MSSATDPAIERAMDRALRLAARGAGRTSPNPLVGAVLLRQGEVVGEGWHRALGGPHAEVEALRRAGDRARGATLVVTLEPCSHHGRTPPCVDALLAAGVGRVVAAMRDPDPRVAGRGIRRLRAAGVPVEHGLRGDRARRLNEGYLMRLTAGRPFVTLKLAFTVDGRLAVEGRRYLTGPASRREVHRLRDRMDAVLVGVGTVVADDPLLTVREVRGRDPLRVVADTDARTPPDARIVRTRDPQRTLILVGRDAEPRRVGALRAAGVLVASMPRAEGGIDLGRALRWLGEQGLNTVLAEPGARLAAALIREGLADRLVALVAPIVGGQGPRLEGLADPLALREARTRRLGDDLLVEGYLR